MDKISLIKPKAEANPTAKATNDVETKLTSSYKHVSTLKKSPLADLPTSYGQFTVIAYKDIDGEHLALIKSAFSTSEKAGSERATGKSRVIDGKIKKTPLIRIHSQCVTGDALTSLRCDCGEQLSQSMKIIAKERGILLYLQQEGRGIGLFHKIAAYHHQDQGLDTVEANVKLGFKDDARDYTIAAKILEDLGVDSVRLLTNNPRKIKGLQMAGIKVVERVPILIDPNEVNVSYLTVKQKKLGHELGLKSKKNNF